MSDLKQAIKQNYVKCAKDPSYFINQYCTIQHPQRGKIKFKLYPFQYDVLKEYQSHDYNIILKSRQLGISTLSAAYALWMMLFQNDKNILVIATAKDTAKNLITKVRIMYEALPAWLKTAIVENNKLSLIFKNGSQIKAIASNESAGRSEALSLLIIDEAAFIEKIDTIWTAAQQTLATGGRCLAISTPNGVGNWFHKTWQDAQDGANKFNTVKLHWTCHPERDEEWRQEQNKILGPSQAAQECDADFLSSGRSVVDPVVLEWYKEKMCCEPIEKSGFDRNLWIWGYPDYSKNYLICADVARGDGTDYSAAQVFDLEEMEQVAEYKGQLGTTEFGNFLIELATKYNDALLVVENNNIGWATLQTIIDRGYENLFYQEKNHLVVKDQFVRVIQGGRPGNIPWDAFDVDVVIDATGQSLSRSDLELHLKSGAKRVFTTKNPKNKIDRYVIPGINEETIKVSDKVISTTSSTTQVLALMIKMLDETFGLERAMMTTVHAYTADQPLADAAGIDLRRSRSAAENIIPNTLSLIHI